MSGFKVFNYFLLVSLICSVLFSLPYAAGAASPSSPNHKFYGTVRYNGKVVGAGYVVTAMVNGKEMASATTDDQGQWGVSQPFTVAIAGCALVDFYVNGELVGSAASCIETNELNLTAPWPLKASASTSSTAATVDQAVSGTADSQDSLSSTYSDSKSLTSTTTFFIGPQPSSAQSSSTQPSSTPQSSTPQSSIEHASTAAPGSEAVLPSVDSPIAKTGLQEEGASVAPDVAGTAAHVSIIEILVMSAIVIWSIIIVIVLLLIIKRRPEY